jgi:hypothetical protein
MQDSSPAQTKMNQENKMKPRNHVVLALLKAQKKQGAHGKSKKAIRQQERIKLVKGKFD